TILPGLLILYLLKLNKLELAARVVLTVGLSIAFLMFFGLLLNGTLFAIGYTTPLSTTPLVIGLSIILLIMCTIAYKTNRKAFSPNFSDFKLNTADKAFLVLPAIFPFLSIYGMHLMNTTDNNVVLMVLLFLIPAYAILITFQRHKITSNIYPIAIIMISFALLSMLWLRSEHILGHDIHLEYYLFHMTLANSHYGILEHSPLGSSLSISLLPAIFQSLLNVNWEEYLFKGIYVLICTFTPLVVYVISKKYLGNLYAFLAALFFISQVSFLSTAGSPRTNLAIFFFALSIMVLFHDTITEVKRKSLFLIFMVATILSHYSTAYVFFFLLLFTYLLGLFFKEYTLSKKVTLIPVCLFFVSSFLWYGQLTQAPLVSVVRYIAETVGNLQNFFVEEMRHPSIGLLTGKELATPVLSHINLVIHWASFAFIGIGIIGALLKRRGTISSPHQTNSRPEFLKSKFEMEYCLLALMCAGMLVAMVALPYASILYGMQRLYSQMAVILSGFFVFGGMLLSKYIRVSLRLLILLILVAYFLFTTYAIYEASGIHTHMLLTPKAPAGNYELVHDQETRAAQWLKGHMDENPRIYTADMFGRQWLVSQGKISWRLINGKSFIGQEEINGYLYLSHNNVVNDKLVIGGRGERTEYDMSEYTNRFENKNKLYANGGSEIWR
ncbi:DUF2206 domain-containing protein, partial [Candidatus Aerophobetes bacterium]